MASAWISVSSKASISFGLGLLLVADDADHLVEVEVGDQQAVEDVQAGLDLGQAVAGAADQHLAAVVEEGLQRLLQAHDAGRAAGVQDVHVDAGSGSPGRRA